MKPADVGACVVTMPSRQRGQPGQVRSLPSRAASGLVSVCALFALAAVAIGVAGILGVQSTTRTGSEISTDEVATASATARAIRAIDTTYVTAERLLVVNDPATRSDLATTLFNQLLPEADGAVAALVAIHASDEAGELAGIAEFNRQWVRLRAMMRTVDHVTGATAHARDRDLAQAFAPLGARLNALVDREDADAQEGRAKTASTMQQTTWLIVGALGLVLLSAVAMAGFGIRRIRRALRPEQDQTEFADTMQLADDEDEAHDLLKRHLERAVPYSKVTVLNRNNSADRLEAVTDLDADSCLLDALKHAAPRSCLAVRSGRTHRQDGDRSSLLNCSVCSGCDGSSTCMPLTVGGEVIGSVLVNPPYRPTPEQDDRVRTSVAQAAPVLANLRNLAIAELRAATDSLTGLPNKRAVNDTLKRMLAQSSRAMTPFALLLIDLDHFKEINDRLGHPVGDQALASVAAALTGSIRDSDFAGRNGGEEFAVMLPATDLDGAVEAAEKIRLAIAAVTIASDVKLTASLGVAIYPDHATSTEKLERLADAALYVAKRTGRNRVEIATAAAIPAAAIPAPASSAVSEALQEPV
jgi:diguanylate cyclase (GGDEF)-like protein